MYTSRVQIKDSFRTYRRRLRALGADRRRPPGAQHPTFHDFEERFVALTASIKEASTPPGSLQGR